jgi:hypothetical protein
MRPPLIKAFILIGSFATNIALRRLQDLVINRDYFIVWVPILITLMVGLLHYSERLCVYSWQLASDGSRCCGRAASVRAGGKDKTDSGLFGHFSSLGLYAC